MHKACAVTDGELCLENISILNVTKNVDLK